LIAGLAAADFYREPISQLAGNTEVRLLELSAPGSVASWFASVLYLLASAHCLFVYSIRRHRLNDDRGRYRVWLWAAVAMVVLSVNAVTGLHTVLAAAAAQLVGWTALRANAVWWLAAGTIVFVWTGYRTFRDMLESRLATWGCAAAMTAYAIALAVYLGGLSTTGISLRVETLVWPTIVLLGEAMLLAALAAYARFVTLDADGMIDARPAVSRKKPTPKQSRVTTMESAANAPLENASQSSPSDVSSKRAKRDRETTRSQVDESEPQWVDGSVPEKDDYDGDEMPGERRKLTKLERKRLRKLRTEGRRAA
jgi:cation transport ATPase